MFSPALMSKSRPLSVLVFLTLLLSPLAASASFAVNISPAIIDGEGKSREILRYTMTIENNTKQTVSLYPWVQNITEAGESYISPNADPATSLAHWLQFSRQQLDIKPGDSVELPLLVQINLRAKPGYYHAVVHFSDGPNRIAAELDTEKTASLTLNIRVLEDANERLQLGTFTPDKNIFSTDQASFSYRLENIGNRGLVPEGKIRIYDRKGEEVAVIDANQSKDKLEPEAKQMLGAVWSSGDRFGRHKAMLDLQYGGHGTLQDTVYFWVLPWKKLLSLFLTLGFICTLLALLFHSYTASGGKKLAYVTERFADTHYSRDEFEDAQEVEPSAFRTTVVGVFGEARNLWATLGKKKLTPSLPEHEPSLYIDRLEEVATPPRQRTRYMTPIPPSTGSVRLTGRPKPRVDPAHIINLKK